MASSQVESTRLLHQEVEQHTREMVQDLLREGKTTKDRILNDHRVARRLGVLLESAQKVIESYDDPDGLRKQELEDISGENVSVFYDRLKTLREHHRKFPGASVRADPTYELKLKVKFSSEEAHGKFLDLHQLFERFLNMPIFERCDYLQYLRIFDKFDTISREDKLTGDKGLQYRKYLEDMLTYIKGFLNRVHPLVSVDKLEKMIEEDFKVRWEAKSIPAWFETKRPATTRKRRRGFDSGPAPAPERPEFSLETSSEEKEKVDPEKLEENPLYCKPCGKLFAKETVFTAHLKGRPHKKAVERKAAKVPTNTTQVKKEVLSRLLALMEDKIGRFVEILKEELVETQKRVERKQTQTLDEIQADLEEQSDEEEASDSENEAETEKPLYNPLNLPLGWDGKPIPYWLYKLHGLNIEYKCEICGDYSYWGPRAFERHFKEWRHAYGMRCLNIPNTKHFMNITTFKDARILHEKLKRELSQSGWKPEEEEEFEDAEGNVFNKKTYDDLRRQGLV